MQADAIIAVLKRWIEVLARLVLTWREHRRSQRTLMISEENGAPLVHQSGANVAGRKAEPKPMVLSTATAKRVARSARGRFVILTLSADKIVIFEKIFAMVYPQHNSSRHVKRSTSANADNGISFGFIINICSPVHVRFYRIFMNV